MNICVLIILNVSYHWFSVVGFYVRRNEKSNETTQGFISMLSLTASLCKNLEAYLVLLNAI